MSAPTVAATTPHGPQRRKGACVSLQGSGWVTRGGLARRTLDGSQASGESLARPMPSHPEQLLKEWTSAPGIYCHGNWRPVKLVEVGAVCSCCGTLIPWYVT